MAETTLMKLVYFDLFLMVGLLGLFVVGVVMICLGGCTIVCFAPFLPRMDICKKQKVIEFEKCFSSSDRFKNDVCCICLVEYDQNTISSNSCGHEFHSKCIKEWIANDHGSCPLCKQEFGTKKIVEV